MRGEGEDAKLESFSIELDEGMVVLDCVHRIQHEQQPDLAVRWNCKAGKCGSCSAEINGRPRLMCMTRMSDVVEETPEGQAIEIRPMKAFPHVKDLVTDVSWNYDVAQRIKSTVQKLWIGSSIKWKLTEYNNSENALNASCASTLATCFETMLSSMTLQARETSFDLLSMRCTHLTPKIEFLKSRRNSAWNTATLPDVARKSARQEFKSLMMRLSNSKSAWWTGITIHCSVFGGLLPGRT